jgi:hypothetical protein
MESCTGTDYKHSMGWMELCVRWKAILGEAELPSLDRRRDHSENLLYYMHFLFTGFCYSGPAKGDEPRLLLPGEKAEGFVQSRYHTAVATSTVVVQDPIWSYKEPYKAGLKYQFERGGTLRKEKLRCFIVTAH